MDFLDEGSTDLSLFLSTLIYYQKPNQQPCIRASEPREASESLWEKEVYL